MSRDRPSPLYNAIMVRSELAKMLTESRAAAGLTQVQAAAILEINQSTLSGYETDKSKPSAAMLNRLAKLYKLGARDLLLAAGYLEPDPEVDAEALAPVNLGEIEGYSPGLREFLESDEAQLMRVSWSEVRSLMNLRFYTDPRGKTAQQWRRILADQRDWDTRSPFGLENTEEELVWQAGNPPG